MIKKVLLVLLLIIAVAMVLISIKSKILPPALTGLGFVIIAILFYKEKQ